MCLIKLYIGIYIYVDNIVEVNLEHNFIFIRNLRTSIANLLLHRFWLNSFLSFIFLQYINHPILNYFHEFSISSSADSIGLSFFFKTKHFFTLLINWIICRLNWKAFKELNYWTYLSAWASNGHFAVGINQLTLSFFFLHFSWCNYVALCCRNIK